MFESLFYVSEYKDPPIKPEGYEETKQMYKLYNPNISNIDTEYSINLTDVPNFTNNYSFTGTTITFNKPSNLDNLVLLKEDNISIDTTTNSGIVIDTLMRELDLTREQAAGIAGVLLAESGINPNAWNKGEKNGTYKSSSANNQNTAYGTKNSPWSYGAGIAQWTFTNRKEKAIMGGLGVSKELAKNIIQTTGIEGLSLQDLLKMLVYELKSDYKNTLEGIKKCNTASEAAATYYCHAIGGYSTSTNPATSAEIKKMNIRYGTVGAKSLVNKGMNYAQNFVNSYNFEYKDIGKFVLTLFPILKKVISEKGLNTKIIPYMLKQLALESDYGMKRSGSYNLGGIKYFGDDESKKSRQPNGIFRNYNSLEEFINDYVDLINRNYQGFNVTSEDEYLSHLFGNNKGKKHYSDNPSHYRDMFKNMKTLDKYIKLYV